MATPVADPTVSRQRAVRRARYLTATIALVVLTPVFAWSQVAAPEPVGGGPGPIAGAVSALRPSAALPSGQAETQEAQGQLRPQGVTAGWNDGFVVQSVSGDYRLQLGLLIQADGRFALDDEGAGVVVDTFALRRIRPYLRGRIAQRFEFVLNPDFAGGTLVVQDAYLDTRFSPAFVVRVGKGKTPFGLERLMAVSSLPFFERALPSALAPNRDVGIQVLGDLRGGVVSYGVGLLNGVPDGASADLDTNDGKDLAGRILVRPFGPLSTRPVSGLSVGLAGTTGRHSGALPTIRTPSVLQNFVTYPDATADGRLTRYSPQASYYFKRASALAEYVHTRVPARRGATAGDLSHTAWQIAGLFVLTEGDVATERGVRPQHDFDFGSGHLGALQLGARYHTLVVEEDAFALGLTAPGSSREAKAWTVGLNWYLNPYLKYVVNFEQTRFGGSDPAARGTEHALAFRAQVNF